ncbi:cell filamentation protein, partial [Clavibacter michiganensis subsp. michiganensis]|uniref:Fic family protein n=1 Tax=Clavibacter michiganensis TaxID=28447 RepID=UPI00136653BD
GTGIPYCRPDFIEANLDTLFRKLEREDYLTGLDADTFTERLAARWGELSAIHPWRDGNTRSQSMYVAALAQRAGHPIDWARIDVDELRHHRLQAIAGTDRPLAGYLRAHLIDTAPARAPEGSAPLAAARAAGREQGAARDAGEAPAYSRRELAERTMLRAAGIDPNERSTPHRDSSSTIQGPHEPHRARGDESLER